MLSLVAPTLLAELSRVLSGRAAERLHLELEALEQEIADSSVPGGSEEQQEYLDRLKEEIASPFGGVDVRLDSYGKAGRSVSMDEFSDLPGALMLDRSPEGLAQWVLDNGFDHYQLSLNTRVEAGESSLSVSVQLYGYMGGASLSVEVEDWNGTQDSSPLVNAVMDEIESVVAPFAAVEENAEFPVFLGHGHGSDWKLLKDALEDAGYPVLAFESVPRAGDVNINVVEASIRAARAAVLHLTPDDELTSGHKVGRQNVIHEVGFAQGALGVRQVVIVQQEGALLPSNLDGVSVIRYVPNSLYDKLRELVETMKTIQSRVVSGETVWPERY